MHNFIYSDYLKDHNRFAEAAVVLVDYAYVGCVNFQSVTFYLLNSI